MIHLQAVTLDNFRAVIRLEVTEDQRAFVAANVYSLAEAYVSSNCVPLAIYDDTNLVGFTMYNRCNPDDGQLWIFRLMIDQHYQQHGYGKAAMCLLLARIKAEIECSELYPTKPTTIYISVEPENEVAKKLYLALGFKATQRIVGGEEVLVMALATSKTDDTRRK